VKLATSSGRRFGPTQVLSGARGAMLGGIAAGPAGNLAVSWDEDTGEERERTVPYARVGTHAGGFAPAELIGRCAGSPLCIAGGVKVAFDPVSAQPTAAWVERLDANHFVLSANRR